MSRDWKADEYLKYIDQMGGLQNIDAAQIDEFLNAWARELASNSTDAAKQQLSSRKSQFLEEIQELELCSDE